MSRIMWIAFSVISTGGRNLLIAHHPKTSRSALNDGINDAKLKLPTLRRNLSLME